MLSFAVRTLLVAIGVLVVVGGLLTISQVDAFGGLWLVAVGAVLVAAGIYERHRYRSAAAELAGEPSGPGGGETTEGRLEARFRPTPEVFSDPTTGQRMRVLVDPATGERRYRAEG